MDCRVREARDAPSFMRDEKSAERPANRAGEAAKQRQVGDRAAGALPIEAAERGEAGIVEAARHAQAHEQPGQQIKRIGGGRRQQEVSGGQEQGTRGKHRPAAVTLDQPAGDGRRQPGKQESAGEPGNDRSQRPARLGGDRRGEHRGQIVGRSPGEDLRDAKRRDEDMAAAGDRRASFRLHGLLKAHYLSCSKWGIACASR